MTSHEGNAPTVAIVGASGNRDKYGNKSVRAHLRQGFQVFPVHPSESEIENLPAYKSVLEIPVERLDRVSMYVPPQVGIDLLEEIAQAGPKEVWFNPGSESEQLIAKAKQLGLNTIIACSIIDVGEHPTNFS